MAVTDLTGTTWVFKDEVVFGWATEEEIEMGESHTVPEYIELFFKSFDIDFYCIETDPNEIQVRYLNADGGELPYNNGKWFNEGFKRISITGGTDSTNPEVIEWFYVTATLQTATTAYTIDYEDLTAEGGSGTISGATSAEAGETVTFTATPDTGSNVSNIIIDRVSDNIEISYIDNGDGTYSFIMPDDDVTVTVYWGKTTTYTITTNITNGTASSTNPTTIDEGGTVTLIFTPNSGYRLPEVITVLGADVDYNLPEGKITLSNPTGNVTIEIDCVRYFTISASIENGTALVTNPTRIDEGKTATLRFTANTGYELPAFIGTAYGADFKWNQSRGVLTITNPTDDISVAVVCNRIRYNITASITNGVASSDNPSSIAYGTTATLTFTANEGYELPDSISFYGAEYTWDKSTGTLTISNPTDNINFVITCSQITTYPKINSFTYHGKQIRNINGKPIRYVHYNGNTYEMVYSPILPKLATPQNVSADGTTVSWDAVENATSYEIFADGVSIGTVSDNDNLLTDSDGNILQDSNGNNLEFKEA